MKQDSYVFKKNDTSVLGDGARTVWKNQLNRYKKMNMKEIKVQLKRAKIYV